MGKFQLEDNMAKGGKRPLCIAFCVFSVICILLLALTIFFATRPSECTGTCDIYIFGCFVVSLYFLVLTMLYRAQRDKEHATRCFDS